MDRSVQMTFQRREQKYLLTRTQRDRLLECMESWMQPDSFGPTNVRSLYLDTDRDQLVRRSLEKPVYKEKLRLRSYGPAGGTDPVFVELKKKYRDVVYKRRLLLPEEQVMACFLQGLPLPGDSQVGREIDYFRRFYFGLRPAVLITCDRAGYASRYGGEFRMTLDEHLLGRDRDLTLGSPVYGVPLLEEDQVLLEIKSVGGMPLWLAHFLSREGIGRTSFSKYGAAWLALKGQPHRGGHCYAQQSVSRSL